MKTFTLKKTLGFAAALSFGLGVSSAYAGAPVYAQFFPGELNQLSDNDAERIGFDANGNGLLDLGDTIRGITTIETIEDLSGGTGTNNLGGAGGPNNEMTGIFEAVVTGITDLGNGLANISFGAYAPFAAEFGLPAGSILAFFDDPANDYTRLGGSLAVTEASATGGNLILAYGIDGSDSDELFRAMNVDPDVDLSNVAPGTAVGTFVFQFSQLLNNTPLTFEQVSAGSQAAANDTYVPCVADVTHDCRIDFNGSGSAVGTQGINTPYGVFTNFDATVRVVVPEIDAVAGTGALTLLGGALVLMGERRRRRG